MLGTFQVWKSKSGGYITIRAGFSADMEAYFKRVGYQCVAEINNAPRSAGMSLAALFGAI